MWVKGKERTAAEVDVNAARQIMEALPMLHSYKNVGTRWGYGS